MAHIEAFTIHGLAGRTSPVSRVLDRHVNVFWGLNGSGKTSLLKILHAALENDDSSLDRVPFERAEVLIRTAGTEELIRRTYDANAGSNVDQIEIEGLEELSNVPWREVVRSNRSGWVTTVLENAGTSREGTKFQHAFLPISRVSQTRTPTGLNNWRSPVERQAIDDAAFDEIFAEQVRRRWQIYSNSALSLIREIQQQGLASILAVLFGGGSGISEGKSEPIPAEHAFTVVRDFLRGQRIQLRVGKNEFIKRYEEEQDLQRVVDNIQSVTDEVEVALRPQAEFQAIIEELYSGNKHLVFAAKGITSRNTLQVEIDGRPIPLQSLSSGEKQLLQLLLEILAAESSTVMIDEPELSMHVDWQQRLVASMVRVNPHCQMLLATHSPEVMADVPEEFVFEL
jgi:energy-coupling factor transporter ATP-binding protein EcfA2